MKIIIFTLFIFIIAASADLFAQSGGSQGQQCVIVDIKGTVITANCPGGVIQTNSIYSTSGYYRIGDQIDQNKLSPEQQQTGRNSK